MRYDFSLLLTVLSALTGLAWLADRLFFAKTRALMRGEGDQVADPWWVDYARSLFPVLFFVLMLRSFIAEPFRIPSGSMMPNLLIGDFILVNKFTYGIRLPVLNTKIIPMGEPKRGDVVVFRPPHHPEQDWIKRVVGLPGDEIVVQDNRVTVNGKPAGYVPGGVFVGVGQGRDMTGGRLLAETFADASSGHTVLVRDDIPFLMHRNDTWTVPEGHYFVMGDNRDNSEDSRYWGFMPEQNLVGRAFLIWMNWDGGVDFSRIGDTIH